jgi:GTP-binding protein
MIGCGMGDNAERARKLFAGHCVFVAGATTFEALPESALPEIAFVGRSNVGKSSLINALLGRSALARVSRTPGRTRQINLFDLRDSLMLADLPGYGFARVSKAEASSWNDLIQAYLRTRKTLRRVVLLIDARRGAMTSDESVMDFLDEAAVAFVTVLTKADALTSAEIEAVRAAVMQRLETHPASLAGIIATSSRTGMGIPDLRASLAELVAH